jgi:8-oxo-dGTP pyrophosphatase MutT (NUDIX family)
MSSHNEPKRRHSLARQVTSAGENHVPEKTLFANRFLALIERDGYTYMHEVRCDGKIVSLLPFRRCKGKLEFLARKEICPAHGAEAELCSITGGIDIGSSAISTAQRELYEEAGYRAEESEFIELGKVYPSKSADTLAYLFAIDVTEKAPAIPKGDGSRWEANASVQWVTKEECVHLQDPLIITSIVRHQEQLINGNR